VTALGLETKMKLCGVSGARFSLAAAAAARRETETAAKKNPAGTASGGVEGSDQG
jgi:hypothetical protein